MPRSSSRSSSPARSSPAVVKRSAPVPAPTNRAMPPAPVAPQQGGGMLSGLGRTVAEGFAFGTGSALARAAVGSVLGGFGGSSDSAQQAPVEAQAPNMQQQSFAPTKQAQTCDSFQQDFVRCLQENKNDIGACQIYMSAFDQCQKDAKL
jgi:hypothetical protein